MTVREAVLEFAARWFNPIVAEDTCGESQPDAAQSLSASSITLAVSSVALSTKEMPTTRKDTSPVQPHWFGARKPKFRAFIEGMNAMFEPYVAEIVRADMSALVAWSPREVLLGSVLVDQTVRNIAAIARLPRDTHAVQDAKALVLAQFVDHWCFGGPDTNGVIGPGDEDNSSIRRSSEGVECTCAEFCFFTLVLRHARQHDTMQRSRELLKAALDNSYPKVKISTSSDKELCNRFLDETEELIRSLEAEKYIEQAMTQDVPALFSWNPNKTYNMEVLDQRCRAIVSDCDAQFASPFGSRSDNTHYGEMEAHPVVEAMAEALARDQIGADHSLLLSLSGGVDSMAHAALLKILQPRFGFRFAALHIRHPNRNDAMDEEGWVGMAAARMGLPLYTYSVLLQRPHGDVRTGISRERYEDVTKRIRFRMYREALKQLKGARCEEDEKSFVVMGHHNDDADENRLAELGKGNIVDIDGMCRLSECFNVILYRPLLNLRKQSMFEFADVAKLPYMVDSTPKWSRRGWTRRTLDRLPNSNEVLQQLQTIGNLSEKFKEILNNDVGSKLEDDVFEFVAERGDKDDKSASQTHHSIVVLILNDSMKTETIESIKDIVQDMFKLIKPLAIEWNDAIAQNIGVPEDDNDDLTKCVETQERSSPLQPIRIHEKEFVPSMFLFNYCIKTLLRRKPALNLMGGTQAAGRSLAHVWSMAKTAKRDKNGEVAVWGALNQRVPCVWLPSHCRMAMYNSDLRLKLANSEILKRNLVREIRDYGL